MTPDLKINFKIADKFLKDKDFKSIRGLFRNLEIADIAEYINDHSFKKALILFRLIPILKRPDLFGYLDFDKQIHIIEDLPESNVKMILDKMEPVDRTKFLDEVPTEIKDNLLAKLSPDIQDTAIKLLSYPEESVGRIMSPDFISLNGDTLVKDAIEQIQWNSSKYPEEVIQNIFVTDQNGYFLGALSLARLIQADPPSKPLSKIMQKNVESISVFEDNSIAVDYFRKYDRYFIPVVERDVLVGVIYSDEVFDVAEEDATEDIQQFGGSATLEDSYFNTSKWDIFRKRAGWLAVLFLGMMGTANALEHFDSTIKEMSYLVAFLPLIISSGGNSGSQAASIMIRGLAVKEMEIKDWSRILKREVVIGSGLGVSLGILGYFRASYGSPLAHAGLIVAFSLIGIVTFGAVIGSMLPFLLKLLRLDPAVSSSPVIASVVDIVGIIIFFKIAIFIHGAF